MSTHLVRFVKGQNQASDKRLMPNGTARRIVNLRHEKEGRLVKRPGRYPAIISGSFERYSVDFVEVSGGRVLVYGESVGGILGSFRGQTALLREHVTSLTETEEWSNFRPVSKSSLIPSCSSPELIVVSERECSEVQHLVMSMDRVLVVFRDSWTTGSGHLYAVVCGVDGVRQSRPSLLLSDTSLAVGAQWKVFRSRVDTAGLVWIDSTGKVWIGRFDPYEPSVTDVQYTRQEAGTNGEAGTLFDVVERSSTAFVLAYECKRGLTAPHASDAIHLASFRIAASSTYYEQVNRVSSHKSGNSLLGDISAVGNAAGTRIHAARAHNRTSWVVTATITNDQLAIATDVILTGGSATSYPRPVLLRNSSDLCTVVENYRGPGTIDGIRIRYVAESGTVSGTAPTRYGMHTMCRPRQVPNSHNRILFWSNEVSDNSIQKQAVLIDFLERIGSSEEELAKPIARAAHWTEALSSFNSVGEFEEDNYGNLWAPCLVIPNKGGTEVRNPALLKVKPYQRHDCTPLRVNGDLYMASGMLVCYDGVLNPEAGYLYYPEQYTTPQSGYSVATEIQTRTYAYRATYESVDANGRRHQSSPSVVYTRYATNSCYVTLEFVAYHPTRRHEGNKIVVWRNEALGSSNYYRLGEVAVPDANSGTSVVFTDTISDEELTAEGPEVLYTVASRVDWVTPPSSSVACEHGGRVWTATLDKLYFSNVVGQVVQDDSVTFYESAWIRLPSDILGLASFDGMVVALCEGGIYAIGGEGPTETNVGEFNDPWRLQVGVSLARGLGEQRSVAKTPKGLVFRSLGGIELIRFGWSVTTISDEVSDELAAYPYVQSVVVDEEAGMVRFLCTETDETSSAALILCWNYEESDRQSGRSAVWVWTVETAPTGASCLAMALGKEVLGTDDGTTSNVYIERASVKGDYLPGSGSAYIQSSITMGRFHPGGEGGFGRVKRLLLQGERAGTATVSVKASFDDGATFEQDTYVAGGSSSGVEAIVEYRMARQRGNSVLVEILDSGSLYSGTGDGGVIYNSLTYEYDKLPGGPRLPGAQRIG